MLQHRLVGGTTEMGYGMDRLVAYKMVESWEKKSLEEIQEEFNSVLGNP